MTNRLLTMLRRAWDQALDLCYAVLAACEQKEIDLQAPYPRESSRSLAADIAETYGLGEKAEDRIHSRIFAFGQWMTEDAQAIIDLLARPEAVTDQDRKDFAAKVGDLRRIIKHFSDEADRLNSDLVEQEALYLEMAGILNRTAKALHGGPRADGGCWSWQDLPDRAEDLWHYRATRRESL